MGAPRKRDQACPLEEHHKVQTLAVAVEPKSLQRAAQRICHHFGVWFACCSLSVASSAALAPCPASLNQQRTSSEKSPAMSQQQDLEVTVQSTRGQSQEACALEHLVWPLE